jgi:hypothetical protein
MPLTRMFFAPRSWAMLRVRWLIAALDEVGRHAHVLVFGRHRRDVEHRAAAGGLDVRHSELGQPEGREHIDLIGPAEILHRHVEGLGPAAAGIVHKDRQAAEIVDRRLHRCLQVLFLGDVAGKAHGLAAGVDDALGHLVGRLLLEVADHNRSAGACEHLGDAFADTRHLRR